MKKQLTLWILIILIFSSCATSKNQSARVEKGMASYYANKFNGRKTASGEKYHHNQMTAAHRTLPFGTIVQIKNLNNGKTVKVRINDRGPFVRGRIIDLSKKAARQLDMIREGVVPVEIRY
ncbi:septal ring lytic transglycosylase RlpA family protein [Echinicola sp. CAU 1574]|uniref:Probable endolytic peptidoglycan transglycosylase RlpA n=1 Tax=Echinicola arenosa TaxID=2774144 RepID=A0ABR9AQN6_9BACT|nr:septal ring lytic transglycosylase RlpA family protein [Echinicola arenosa]MBD8490188.1 septal ring lytic transglycosylase RlpA family protein [Echinicola arenosa]